MMMPSRLICSGQRRAQMEHVGDLSCGVSRRTSQEFCTPAALNILAQMNHLLPPGEHEQISLFLRCDSCSHSQQQSHWSVMSFSARFRLWDAVGWGSTRQGCDTFMSPRRAVNWQPNGKPELLWTGETEWTPGCHSSQEHRGWDHHGWL